MTEDPAAKSFSEADLAGLRQNFVLLKTQLEAGTVDARFLGKQIDRVLALLPYLESILRHGAQHSRWEALYNVTRLLGSSLDLQTVLDQVMDAILQLTGAERGFLMLRNDDGQVDVRAARNFDQQTLSAEHQQFSRTIVNRVLDTGEPIVTTNASEDPRFASHASVIGPALRSTMAAPLRARGNVIGVVYVENRAVAGLFDEQDLAALEALAGQAAVAIDNAQLFSATDQQLAARVEELRQLRRMDLQLNETLDTEKALRYTLEWACRLANAEAGHAGMVETDEVPATAHYGTTTHDTIPILIDGFFPQVREVLETGRTYRPRASRRVGLAIVPVRSEGRVIAVLVLRRGTPFTEEEIDLAERVAARGAIAIENARLYAAVKAADRAKSEFVGIVAHDLKVPMTSILGYTELVQMMGGLQPQQVHHLGKIRDTVRRMENLVSDLSDISRIESGHFFMNETRVAVADVVRDVRDAISSQIDARGHTYVEDIQPGLPDMRVDYYRLLQVLTNLCSNAYKYTPDGGTITLRARLLDRRIHFSVSDTGIGLSPEGIARLGTKFWRAEDDFTRSQPGTGLGFAITRSLVEQMGSAITIQSEVGKGSTFSFSVTVDASSRGAGDEPPPAG